MAGIMMVYGTRQGHTAHIADRIASVLRAAGHHVDEFDLNETLPPPPVRDYDAVLVGASVHARGFEREVHRWVHRHAHELASVRNAFFTVSLTAATCDAKSQAEIDAVVAHFDEHTGWRPARVENFAGALVYSKYNWLARRIMRHIVRREANGRYRDMSHDYDLTDYAQVDAFARELAVKMTAAAAA